MAAKRVLSVGQCAADNWSIARAIENNFDAEVVPVDSAAQALEHLEMQTFALVLVNRLFDRDGASGLELIKTIKEKEAARQAPVMLVSNYEDAQRKAQQKGAVPGFGKASLEHPDTLARLKIYLS